jgi:hypothetical protein
MARDVLTEIHGEEIGLDDDRALVIKSGIIRTKDGSPISFPDGADGSRLPQRIISTAHTLELIDAGYQLYRPTSDSTARIWTIPANAAVAFPIGSILTMVNDGTAGNITINIDSDTLLWGNDGSTGQRVLTPYGAATLLKVTATRWWVYGFGLS